MTIPDYKNAAVVYLPAVSDGRLSDTALRRWLARSELVKASEPEEILRKTLASSSNQSALFPSLELVRDDSD